MSKGGKFMYINNITRYSYYSSLWNTQNNSSLSNVPMFNSVNQAVKNALKINGSSGISAGSSYKLSSTAATLKSDAEQLASSARKITNVTDKGTFAQKTATSEDSTKVTATAANGAYNTTYEIQVNQVATAQVNTSNVLDKTQASLVQAGTNTITIAVGDKSKDINFSVTAGDSNEAVLNKMAKAINDSQAGVNATVVKNSLNNNIKLQLTSEKTGTSNVFSITDKTGNAVANTGISNISSASVDAKYTLDNVAYTSDSNYVTADKGRVTFNLKNSTTNEVKVTVKSDSSKIAQDINNFVENYNNLVTNAQANDINDSNTLKGMASIIDKNKYNLQKIGITINEDHTLSVDDKKLKDKIESDSKVVKDIFNGYQAVATRIENFANSITKNPFAATGINNLDVYNKGMIMSYSFANQGSLLNLYR